MSTPDTFTELLREELSPEPDADFAREMDEWAAAGFPRRAADAPQRPRPRRRRAGAALERAARTLRSPLGIAGTGGAVAAVAIAAVLIGDGLEQRPSTTDSGDAASPTAPEPLQDESPGGATSRAMPAPAPGGSAAPEERDRRVERAAQLTLAAPADDFQPLADRVLRVTDSHGGFVLRSQVSTGDDPTGDFQLRIPADRLQPALRDLSALGEVRARSDTGQDVTGAYVSATDRLAAERAERRALLRRLAAADDDARAQRLRDRIDANADVIASLRSQVRDLRERTNYAAVTVTLVEGGSGDEDGGAGAGGTSDALDDSLGLLVGSFNLLVRVLGVAIPAGIVAGAAWWAARTIRRRRREAVLS